MFLSTRQMRRFGELVADVIDDMLAADFEDGFAIAGDVPEEIPGAKTAFRELTRAAQLLPYDWSIDEAVFTNGNREVAVIAGWERRHARVVPATAATRAGRRRAGQVEPAPAPCITPIRTTGGDSAPCR